MLERLVRMSYSLPYFNPLPYLAGFDGFQSGTFLFKPAIQVGPVMPPLLLAMPWYAWLAMMVG